MSLVLACALGESVLAEPLDKWLLEKTEADEALLRSAVLRENGRDIRLLENSTTYVPFFVESPDFGSEPQNYDGRSMTQFFNRQDASLLAGGYLYRIAFGNGTALYALSGGDWDGKAWFSPNLGKELEIDPLKVWAGSGGADFAYATILSGVPPRLVLFDGNGAVKEERCFGLSDPDLEAKIQDAENQYSRDGEPALELVSLAEYLREDDPSWRSVEVTSSFNLRNQHKRPEEIERIEEIETLTRNEAEDELRSRLGQRGVVDEPSSPKVETEASRNNGLANEDETSQSETALRNDESDNPIWLFVLSVFVALGVVVIAVRAFMRGRAS
ncbi:hypothetical protein [Roseibacillus ishigakijimensis]|uniref:Uncharacterized protein n=1 Tax=Roseibacillus ishigakijimensis TaxID=454146 RepID=A0A934RIY7_9BACT|nr:hypothetical protein [Roseibacillus ishigakijimensis]MBK1832492.1 hypothetical protein [Roseibacillus ishigakijimensis]